MNFLIFERPNAIFPRPQKCRLQVAAIANVKSIVDIAIFPAGDNPLDQLLDRGTPLVATALIIRVSSLDATQIKQLMESTQARVVIYSNVPLDLWLPGMIARIEAGGAWKDAIAEIKMEVKLSAHQPGSSGSVGDDDDDDDAHDFSGPGDDGGFESLPPSRFVQAKVAAKGSEVQSLDAGKEYTLNVRVAPQTLGWVASGESLPEPEWRPDESSRVLAVLFHEPNCCPDGLIQTIVLPARGESTTAQFPFTAGTSFNGRITVYFNNRPLIECGITFSTGGLELRTLMRMRSFEVETGKFRESAATLRIEGESIRAIRGAAPPETISIEGYKTALQKMEQEVNKIALEKIGGPDPTAATQLLFALATQGAYLHRRLMACRTIRAAFADTSKLITVVADDSTTRAPLELCYSLAAPASSAQICSSAAKAVARGTCIENCDGSKDQEQHICPMGFWGLQRSIEWRGIEADQTGEHPPPDPGRTPLDPLRQILYGHSARVTKLGRLPGVLEQLKAPAEFASSWKEWMQKVREKSPSLLLLMPHVDKKDEPTMEIADQMKDPAYVKQEDVTAGQRHPVVLLLGCGSASFRIDYQSLPSQFRLNKAAVVIAPVAEILARDAPEIAATFIQQFSATPGAPMAEAILAAKRTLVANGILSGLLLLSFGDADWKL